MDGPKKPSSWVRGPAQTTGRWPETADSTQGPVSAVPGLCLSNRGKGRPCPRHRENSNSRFIPWRSQVKPPLEGGILDDPPHHRGGGEDVRAMWTASRTPDRTQHSRNPPVLPPQGPVPQVQQGGPQQGQDILEVEELKTGRWSAPCPTEFLSWRRARGIGLHLAGGGGELGQVLHQRAVKSLGTHRTSPPQLLLGVFCGCGTAFLHRPLGETQLGGPSGGGLEVVVFPVDQIPVPGG